MSPGAQVTENVQTPRPVVIEPQVRPSGAVEVPAGGRPQFNPWTGLPLCDAGNITTANQIPTTDTSVVCMEPRAVEECIQTLMNLMPRMMRVIHVAKEQVQPEVARGGPGVESTLPAPPVTSLAEGRRQTAAAATAVGPSGAENPTLDTEVTVLKSQQGKKKKQKGKKAKAVSPKIVDPNVRRQVVVVLDTSDESSAESESGSDEEAVRGKGAKPRHYKEVWEFGVKTEPPRLHKPDPTGEAWAAGVKQEPTATIEPAAAEPAIATPALSHLTSEDTAMEEEEEKESQSTDDQEEA